MGFLQQNSFNAIDTYVPLEKMKRMMAVGFLLYDRAKELINQSIPLSQIKATGIFEKLIRIKYDVPNDALDVFDSYEQAVNEAIASVAAAYR